MGLILEHGCTKKSNGRSHSALPGRPDCATLLAEGRFQAAFGKGGMHTSAFGRLCSPHPGAVGTSCNEAVRMRNAEAKSCPLGAWLAHAFPGSTPRSRLTLVPAGAGAKLWRRTDLPAQSQDVAQPLLLLKDGEGTFDAGLAFELAFASRRLVLRWHPHVHGRVLRR